MEEVSRVTALLGISEMATQAMASYMDAEKIDKNFGGVRIGVLAGGCSGLKYNLLTEDKPNDDDLVESHGGVRVFIDPFSAQYLEGVEVDYVTTMAASGFKFTNPNSKGGCGCGASFAI